MTTADILFIVCAVNLLFQARIGWTMIQHARFVDRAIRRLRTGDELMFDSMMRTARNNTAILVAWRWKKWTMDQMFSQELTLELIRGESGDTEAAGP